MPYLTSTGAPGGRRGRPVRCPFTPPAFQLLVLEPALVFQAHHMPTYFRERPTEPFLCVDRIERLFRYRRQYHSRANEEGAVGDRSRRLIEQSRPTSVGVEMRHVTLRPRRVGRNWATPSLTVYYRSLDKFLLGTRRPIVAAPSTHPSLPLYCGSRT